MCCKESCGEQIWSLEPTKAGNEGIRNVTVNRPFKTNKQTKPQYILMPYGNSLESKSRLKPVTEVKNMYLGIFFAEAAAYQRPLLHQHMVGLQNAMWVILRECWGICSFGTVSSEQQILLSGL